MTSTLEEYFSISQVAESLRISEMTVRRAIAAGRLNASRFGGGRAVRISAASLQAWAQSTSLSGRRTENAR